MAFHHSPRIVSDGLVFVLDAANIKIYPGSGTTVTDTINNTSGTFTGAGFYDTSTFSSPVFAFDGSNDYLTFQSNTLGDLGGAYTFSAWIKTTDTQGELFCSFNQSSPYKGMLFGIGFSGNNGKLQIFMSSDAGAQTTTADTGAAVNDGNWKNVAATYDGSNVRFYHNAELSSTISVSNTVASSAASDPLRIGASNNPGPNRIYAGSMGPAYIYNRTLSDAEVLQNYNAMKGRFE